MRKELLPTLSFSRSPFRVFEDIEREMENIFDDLGYSLSGPHTGKNSYLPAAELLDKDSHYLLSLDLPGLSKEDIKIHIQDGVLQVGGERKFENEDRNKGISERYYGKFSRSFTLPDHVKAEDVEASYESGILRLAIPKIEKTPQKKIEIKEGSTPLLSKLLGLGNKKKEEIEVNSKKSA
jgi:HSP20 family protein